MPHKPSEGLLPPIPPRWETSRAVPHSGSTPPPANWQPALREPSHRSRSRRTPTGRHHRGSGANFVEPRDYVTGIAWRERKRFVELRKGSHSGFGRTHSSFCDASDVSSRFVCSKIQKVATLRLRSRSCINRHSLFLSTPPALLSRSRTTASHRLTLAHRIRYSVFDGMKEPN